MKMSSEQGLKFRAFPPSEPRDAHPIGPGTPQVPCSHRHFQPGCPFCLPPCAGRHLGIISLFVALPSAQMSQDSLAAGHLSQRHSLDDLEQPEDEFVSWMGRAGWKSEFTAGLKTSKRFKPAHRQGGRFA